MRLLATFPSRGNPSRRSALMFLLVLVGAVIAFGSVGGGTATATTQCFYGDITYYGPPQITGGTTVGSTLSHTSYGTWSSCGIPITNYEFQWWRDTGQIAGAASSTYTTTAADAARTIHSAVRACNAEGCYPDFKPSNNVGPFTCIPQNTGAPVISGAGAIGSPESTSTGSWSSACGVSSYNYDWLRNGASLGINASSYTPTNADWQQTLQSRVQACNSTGCSGYVTSSNSLTIRVRIVQNSPGNYVEFENNEAQMWIGLRCGLRSETIGDWKPVNRQTGPGYISKMIRTVGNGAGGPRTIVEPNDPNLMGGAHNAMALLQGLGVFGTHIAYGVNNYGVANANTCNADKPPLPPALAGVTSTTVVAAPAVSNGDTGSVTVEATVGDGTADFYKVRYDLRIHPSVVYQWTTVTILCNNGTCEAGRTYYFKEPKIVVDLNGSQDDYTRVSCWDTSTDWSSTGMGQNPGGQYTKWAQNDPVTGTMKCLSGSLNSTRMRALFDYGVPNDVNSPVPSSCVSPASTTDQTCFIAVGRGFVPPGGPGSSLTAWENGGTSFSGTSGTFDQWAVKYSTRATLGSDCGTPADNTPGTNDRRRWEIYGYQPNELGYNERGALFKAWDGGTGPGGTGACYSLYRQIGPANDTWGAFTAYSFGPGWENWTNPS